MERVEIYTDQTRPESVSRKVVGIDQNRAKLTNIEVKMSRK